MYLILKLCISLNDLRKIIFLFFKRLMANICKNFNTSTNNIQTRVTRMFCEALRSEKTPVVSYYGALAGLQELGPEVIKTLILPQISAISARIGKK